jgi:hypothetical protein
LDDCSTWLTKLNGSRFRGPFSILLVERHALYLLYLDESGHPQDPETKFFVLAGFAAFERSTHWLESKINPIAAPFSFHETSAIELR